MQPHSQGETFPSRCAFDGAAAPDVLAAWGERCRPARSSPRVGLDPEAVERGGERVRPVVAQKLEVTAHERVHGAPGRRVEPIVEIEEGHRVLGELEAAPVGGGGDPSHEGVRAEPRVRGVELSDPLENAPAQRTAQRFGGLDLPLGADGLEPERARAHAVLRGAGRPVTRLHGGWTGDSPTRGIAAATLPEAPSCFERLARNFGPAGWLNRKKGVRGRVEEVASDERPGQSGARGGGIR